MPKSNHQAAGSGVQNVAMFFFVEKKETTKSPEKSAEAPPSSLDNLQVDTEAKIGQEKGHIDEVAKETILEGT